MVARFPRPFPAGTDCEIEVRRLYEPEDFAPAGAERGRLLPTDPATQRAIEAVWRIERSRIVAGVAPGARCRLAENWRRRAHRRAEHWPQEGVPDKPGAWLMTTAKHRALDRLRRDQNLARKLEAIGASTWKRRRRWWCLTSSMRSTPSAPTRSATTCCA